jgi:GAF domain-containing protein/HAMP domain-containing protein
MNRQKSEKKLNRRRRNTSNISLQTRFVSFVLLVALVPLIIISIRDIRQTQQALTNGAEVSLRTSAIQTANSLDTFIQTTLDAVTTEAKFGDFVAFLTLSPYTATDTLQARALDLLNKLGNKGNEFILTYAIVDINGSVLLDTVTTNTGKDESNEAYYPLVRFNDRSIVTPVTYSEDKTTSMTFASKILNNNGDYIGILRVKYNSAILQDVITNSVGPSPDTSILLLDQLNIRMADTQHPELILKSLVPLVQIDYLLAVDSHRFLDIPREQQATNYMDFELALDNAAAKPFFRADISPDIPGDDTIAVAFMKTQPWTVAFSRPTSIFLADVQKQTRTNFILVIAASIIIAGIATLVVRNLTDPIISLTKTANSISQGNLTARATIKTRDEIGILANTFNEMSTQIQDLVAGLENRVAQRTTELEQRSEELGKITKQSEKRADELQAIAEIARSISTEKDLEKLLPLITQIVSERFGYYHIGIFLLNDTRNFAVLRAANSLGGQRMLQRRHMLEVGQVGIVGNVTSTGTPRIALDTGADATYFNNPDLPETRSEMALPLTARGIIIGALDVQSTVANAFTEADINILSLLADQIAIAIDNVRLLDETKIALAESESVFREYLASSWQRRASTDIVGYLQTLSGGQLITGKTSKEIDISGENEKDAIAIPIQLREQVIGTLNVRPNTEGRIWNVDEINIVQAVAERLGLALDNARLFEETSSRASRERLVSDITTKIRGTNDPEEMVKTAVEELKRALGVTRIEIIPKTPVAPPDK